MKNILLILITFSLLLEGTAFAKNTISILGSRTCGQWIKNKNEDVGINTSWGSIANHNWLVGYLSGEASALQLDFLNGVDPESIYLYVDNYCGKNPLNESSDGANSLINKLIDRMNK